MSSNKLRLQRLAGTELRAKTIKNFKEALRQQKNIERELALLKSMLQDQYIWCEGRADELENQNSSHE